MKSLRCVVPVGATLCSLLSGWAVGLPGVPAEPSARLARRDLIVWHTLRRVLTREGVRGPEVGAVCVGMGEDGSHAPPIALLHDFSEVEPPVVSGELCSRNTDSGVVLERESGDAATFLSFFNVNDSPGAMTVSVRIEAPGQAPEVRTCRVEVLGVVVRRGAGGPPPGTPKPPPPRVVGC